MSPPTADSRPTVETGCQSQYKKTDGENRLEMVHKKYKENLATEWGNSRDIWED